jgi:hypothetical protein
MLEVKVRQTVNWRATRLWWPIVPGQVAVGVGLGNVPVSTGTNSSGTRFSKEALADQEEVIIFVHNSLPVGSGDLRCIRRVPKKSPRSARKRPCTAR